jgi:F0F1-type ATP synthase alpha subunit
MVAEEQVCVIAGVRGYLDKIVTSKISKFEAKFLTHLRISHSGLLEKIRKKCKLDPADEHNLNTILDAFIPDCGCNMKS